ncbi:MAG: hypothetical protein LKJ47_03875 [Bifidobacteriaceae bacterium]|nr:hypothetical protein [Bifidobacteriaceae bacterium]
MLTQKNDSHTGASEETTTEYTGSRATRERIADAAELYWKQGLKIELVARRLKVSRSTVSRLLALARAQHVVEFTIHREKDSTAELQERIRKRFGVAVIVSETSESADSKMRLMEVGRDAAAWLATLITPNMTIGVAWGRTVESISLHLTTSPQDGIKILQLHGFGDSVLYGENYVTQVLTRFSNAFNAPVYLFPVPAVFASEETRKMMYEEPSIKHMLSMRKSLDVIITSLGTSSGPHPSPLFRSEGISPKDIDELTREHTVGNLASLFFREDGSTGSISVNKRSTGLPRQELLRVPIRIFAVADMEKAAALRVALKAGFITHLIVDRDTAKLVLQE